MPLQNGEMGNDPERRPMFSCHFIWRNILSDETELFSCLMLGVIYDFADLCACVETGQHEMGHGSFSLF